MIWQIKIGKKNDKKLKLEKNEEKGMSIGNKQKSDPSWKDRSDISKINYFFKRFMTFSK